MNIWNKVLLGFIGLAAIAFYFLGARALKTHVHWRDAIAKHEKKLEETLQKEKETRGEIEAADKADMDLRRASIEYHRVLLGRGRIWSDVKFQRSEVVKDEQGNDTVKVLVNVGSPDPHRISAKMVLWCFEKKEVQEQGSFLGQFTVGAVTEKQVELVPTQRPIDWQMERLKAMAPESSWLVYETLPADEREVFADAELDKLLPKESVSEYAEDAKATDGKNARSLRDYGVLLQAYQHQSLVQTEDMDVAQRDAAAVAATLEIANQQIAERDKVIAKLEKDLAKEEEERALIAKHVDALNRKLADLQKSTAELRRTVLARASEIEKSMMESIRRIEAQTRKMAQSMLAP